jgi:hypothetical protein
MKNCVSVFRTLLEPTLVHVRTQKKIDPSIENGSIGGREAGQEATNTRA